MKWLSSSGPDPSVRRSHDGSALASTSFWLIFGRRTLTPRVLSDAGFATSTTTVDVSERESVLALVEKTSSLRLVKDGG